MSAESRITPVILCGGGGTRLWPRSRPAQPKPFLPLIGEETLFVRTVERCADSAIFNAPIIVAGAAHVDLIRAQLPKGIEATIIVEPVARNTAPAIALAAACLDDDDVMLVCPSDHYIADDAAFHDAALRAAELTRDGWLTAFGIRPTAPETGYGYIKRGKPLGPRASRIDSFVEKPDAARARSFLASGGFAWNGGIFCFGASQLLNELSMHRPEMAAAVRGSMAQKSVDDGVLYPAADAFDSIAGESIDYALMENTAHAAVIDVDMGWSDIGSWAAVAERLDSDEHGNHHGGRADLVDCENVAVLSDGAHVSVIGCNDLIVIAEGDDILIVPHSEAQKVGKLPGVQR